MDDTEAYKTYAHHRLWYNKLWLSEQLEYNCGPSGVAPEKPGWYIVRPIINLSGMGVGAKKTWIEACDLSKVKPGYFWCEWFDGKQYSVTYEWLDTWVAVSSWEGQKEEINLSKFSKWIKSNHKPDLSNFLNSLHDVKQINVEFIEDKIIEIHLRTSPDPDYDEIIPIWEGQESLIDKYQKIGYNYITSPDNADGFLKIPRLGFAVKNNNRKDNIC